jgi:hypothetical protein
MSGEEHFNMNDLVFLNPHVDDFVFSPPHFSLLNRKPLLKYNFLVRDLKYIKIDVDYRVSAFFPTIIFSIFPKFLRVFITKFELFLFYKLNKDFSFQNVGLANVSFDHFSLVAFSYKSLNGKISFDHTKYQKYKNIIFHLSHYHVDIRLKAINAKILNDIHPAFFLSGDIDISDNYIFRHFFGWYSKAIVLLSFTSSHRFNISVKDRNNVNKIISVGSFHRLHKESSKYRYLDYIDFTGVTYLHKLRCKYYNLDNIKYTNYISEYKDYSSNIISKYFNVSQKKYFGFDLKQEFLNHNFCIAGEEEIGFPSIVAIEALCCGLMIIGCPDYYKNYPNFIKNRIINEVIIDEIGMTQFIDSSPYVDLNSDELLDIQNYFNPLSTVNRFMISMNNLSSKC